ncbi:MAG: preprotein translocase subunit SecG [Gilvibacter sp.]
MSTFSIFLVLIIIVAFLLVIVVMVQNPKGGGLSGTFGGGGSQQVGGVQNTTNFLDKSTWTLAILLLALILLSNIPIMGGGGIGESKALDGDSPRVEIPVDNSTDNNSTPVE